MTANVVSGQFINTVPMPPCPRESYRRGCAWRASADPGLHDCRRALQHESQLHRARLARFPVVLYQRGALLPGRHGGIYGPSLVPGVRPPEVSAAPATTSHTGRPTRFSVESLWARMSSTSRRSSSSPSHASAKNLLRWFAERSSAEWYSPSMRCQRLGSMTAIPSHLPIPLWM
jgi:hypothetical protein